MKNSSIGRPSKSKAKTPVTITLSDEAIAWLEKKAGDEMRTRASYGAKVIELLSKGMYVSNESPDERTKKSRRILKSEDIQRKHLITLSLSRDAILWLEKKAVEDVRSRATFAAKILEQLARGMYIPSLLGAGVESVGQPLRIERVGVGVIATNEPQPQNVWVNQEFLEYIKNFSNGAVNTSHKPEGEVQK